MYWVGISPTQLTRNKLENGTISSWQKLFVILMTFLRSPGKISVSKPPEVIVEFNKYMDDVREAVEIKVNEPSSSKN